MHLVPITTDRSAMQAYMRDEFTENVFQTWQKLYPVWGFNIPWIGFFALKQGATVGVGGFKGGPKDNAVELSYGTVPGYEGQGIGTEICMLLIKAAISHAPEIKITARTLPVTSASTRILEKNNFKNHGLIQDPEDGPVWEWVWQGDSG